MVHKTRMILVILHPGKKCRGVVSLKTSQMYDKKYPKVSTFVCRKVNKIRHVVDDICPTTAHLKSRNQVQTECTDSYEKSYESLKEDPFCE